MVTIRNNSSYIMEFALQLAATKEISNCLNCSVSTQREVGGGGLPGQRRHFFAWPHKAYNLAWPKKKHEVRRLTARYALNGYSSQCQWSLALWSQNGHTCCMCWLRIAISMIVQVSSCLFWHSPLSFLAEWFCRLQENLGFLDVVTWSICVRRATFWHFKLGRSPFRILPQINVGFWNSLLPQLFGFGAS